MTTTLDCPVQREKNETLSGFRYNFGRNSQFQISVLQGLEKRIETYRFLYRCYLSKNLTSFVRSPHRMWYSSFDALPDTVTLIVESQGAIVGTLTIVYDSKAGFPADLVFSREINATRNNGCRPAEITSLAIDREISESSKVIQMLFNVAYVVSKRIRQATDFLITVHPRHSHYYQQKLLFNVVGKQKNHPKVGNAPASLLMLDLDVRTDYKMRGRQLQSKRPCSTIYKNFLSEEWEEAVAPLINHDLGGMTEPELAYFFKDRSAAVHQRLK